MDDNFEDLVKQATKIEAIGHLRRAYNKFGIEGTEEKIKEVYKNTPGARDYLLDIHYKLLRGELK